MNGNEIRRKFLEFMESRGHAIVPSSALVPENDPTTLFTGSGMQPMVPYLLGEKHPKGVRIADSQKCFRAEDIEEIGDNRHTTFFEMLGNWSFGDYFKEEQIEWMFQFLTEEVGIEPERLYITAFGGDAEFGLERDKVAPAVWQRLFNDKGISADIAEIGSESDGYTRGMKTGERIFYYDASKNWWSRAGVPKNMPVGEPGGPDSEMFYDFGIEHDSTYGPECHPNCDCGRFMEIGNNVFMQYIKLSDSGFSELDHKNIDFGGGLERIAAAAINEPDVFKTDLMHGIITEIERLSGKAYSEYEMQFRVITDHIRGAVFMIGDDVLPSNTEQGYFVRRLLRRSVRYADQIGMPHDELKNLALSVIETYKDHYINLQEKKELIAETIAVEESQFRKTLTKGLAKLEKIIAHNLDLQEPVERKRISGKDAFELFTTYGFPIELTQEIALERNIEIGMDLFNTEMKKHQELSRAGAGAKFKGGLADNSEKVVEYHTVTHLLLAALRSELGDHVHQAGSNITGERLRFDFTHPEKVSRETLDSVEQFVNSAIKSGASVSIETMKKTEAESNPEIEGSFWERYPDEVKVYTIADAAGNVYSKELCGGPHVEHTTSISGEFKITKEESSSAGVRRIKAVLK